jgi:CRP/FNR family transcriptional regulator, cyclic AMP receptor protein
MISLSRPPFDPQVFLAKVEAGKTRTELRRRQIVFSQGDPADAVFSIRKGRVELKVLSPHGKEAILAVLGAGDFFGEGCLTGQPLRTATAALSPNARSRASKNRRWSRCCATNRTSLHSSSRTC